MLGSGGKNNSLPRDLICHGRVVGQKKEERAMGTECGTCGLDFYKDPRFDPYCCSEDCERHPGGGIYCSEKCYVRAHKEASLTTEAV